MMTPQFWLSFTDGHPFILVLAIAFVACLESLAIIGLAVPGVAILFALAALAGDAALPWPALLLAGFIGAVLGDQTSFVLGRFATPVLSRYPPLKNHPQWLEQGHRYFARYGGGSEVLGRFIGPIRPIIPLIAGSCGMSALRFTLFNLGSALVWAPAYLLPGYLTGLGLRELSSTDAGLLTTLLGMIALLVIAQQFHWHLGASRRLQVKLEQRGLTFGALTAWLMIGVGSLSFISALSLQLTGPPAWNRSMYQTIFELGAHQPGLVQTLTHLGDPPLLVAMILLAALTAHWRHRLTGGWPVAVFLAAVLTLNYLLKELLAIARPEVGQELLSSFSFPSGHASAAASAYLLLAIWLMANKPHRTRHLGYCLATAIALLIAASRVLLGVHWPLDVIAGLAEGLVFAGIYKLWLTKHRSTQSVPLSFILPIVTALLAAYLLIRLFY